MIVRHCTGPGKVIFAASHASLHCIGPLSVSRYASTPSSLVIEWTADGTDYRPWERPPSRLRARWPVLQSPLAPPTNPSTAATSSCAWPDTAAAPARLTLWKWLTRPVREELVEQRGGGTAQGTVHLSPAGHGREVAGSVPRRPHPQAGGLGHRPKRLWCAVPACGLHSWLESDRTPGSFLVGDGVGHCPSAEQLGMPPLWRMDVFPFPGGRIPGATRPCWSERSDHAVMARNSECLPAGANPARPKLNPAGR